MLIIISLLFGALCLMTSIVFGAIFQTSDWFWAMIFAGLITTLSTLWPSTRVLGVLLTGFISLLSSLSFLVSFSSIMSSPLNPSPLENLLVGLLVLVAITGFSVVFINNRRNLIDS
jgi:hypothetical protein